jgi:hypothetical protein
MGSKGYMALGLVALAAYAGALVFCVVTHNGDGAVGCVWAFTCAQALVFARDGLRRINGRPQ